MQRSPHASTAILTFFSYYVSVNSNWVHPPPGNPGKIFWASESRPPRQNFLSNSLPRGKKWRSNAWGWGKIFAYSKKLPIKLAKKSLRNSEKFEKVQIFCLENLTKLLYFRLKQNHSKVFKYSFLDIQLKQWIYTYINIQCWKALSTDGFCICKSLICMHQISPNDCYLSWISSYFYLVWKPKLTIHMQKLCFLYH